MKNILAQSNRWILEEFVWSNVLLAFDYDGTLAPIVREPKDAKMREHTRQLLKELATLYPVIIISGRTQTDVRRFVKGLGIVAVIGNHGIEPGQGAGRHAAEVQQWLPGLEKCLLPLKGVMLEDKIYSVAIHYRQSREKKKARATILSTIATLGNVRVISGKQVINIVPMGAPHKGIVLERERERLRCDTALYVGDDDTDEDVFSINDPGRLLSIRVGRKPASGAAYHIVHQRAVDELLHTLLACRRRAQQLRRAAK